MAAGRSDEYLDAPPTRVVRRACRTGGSSATPTISSFSCTAPKTTRTPCARTIAAVIAPIGSSAVASQDLGAALPRRVRLPRVPHPVETQSGNEQVVRLHLHRRPARPGVEGQVACPDPQDVPGRPGGDADPAEPDPARLVDLLPACRRHAHVQTSAPVPVVADRALAARPGTAGGGPPSAGISPTTPVGGSRSAPTGSCCSTSRRYGITRYRYRGAAIPNPWTEATANGRNRGEPVASRGARRVR